MNRERAKELLPVIQAFADGKDIQYSEDGTCWLDATTPRFSEYIKYRVKPEEAYRPFKDKGELVKIMANNKIMFGWVRIKSTRAFSQILYIHDSYIVVQTVFDTVRYTLDEAFEYLTFLDGTPFGVKNQ